MIWTSEEPNAREEEILRAIRQYLEDYRCDTYSEGYDEGYKDGELHSWDEARNKGYDEGWEDACQHLIDEYLQKCNLYLTHTETKHLSDFISESPERIIAAGALINFLHDKVRTMKVKK